MSFQDLGLEIAIMHPEVYRELASQSMVDSYQPYSEMALARHYRGRRIVVDASLSPDAGVVFITDSARANLVAQWCESSGYTDPFQQEGQWWAFPPNGVMPIAIDALIPPLRAQEPEPLHYGCRCLPSDQDIADRAILSAFLWNTYG